jgi:glycosyltransferase involved in cell wall biosynthesis
MLVTCIMPTADRRRFVPAAIRYFQRQDYPHRELLVVDDGADPVQDLIPADPRIRYLRIEPGLTLGAKRNLACSEARGTLIAHWDDDDWSAPWRLSRQVATLTETGAAICGLDRLYFVDPDENRAWMYSYRGQKRWVAGGTLCYRREWWHSHPFEPVGSGEDTRFVWKAPSGRVSVMDSADMYVARIHAGCSSPKRTSSSRWRAVAIEEIRDILDRDWPVFCGDEPASGCPGSGSNPRVTVSIPVYQSRDTLRAAVESILGQTYPHLRVVVTNDGDPRPPWDLLDDIDDARLVRFDLPSNRGRYFADAVVLAATPDRFFAVQDADDISEPERIERLVAALEGNSAEVSFAASYIRFDNGHNEGRTETFPLFHEPPARGFEHRVNHHAGLFNVEALLRIGGYYQGFRIGSDTLITSLLLLTARAAWHPEPLYTYLLRDGSLVNAPETCHDSPSRREAWEGLERLYDRCFDAYEAYLGGMIRHDSLCAIVRRTIESNVPEADRIAIASEAGRLRSVLGTTPGPPGKVQGIPSLESLMWRGNLPFDEWSVSRALAYALVRHLRQRRPSSILETGSGISTVLLALHAASEGSTVVSLEHDARFFQRTRDLLCRFGLERFVDLRYAPLRPIEIDEEVMLWYDCDLPAKIDFLFADGPPLSAGRQAILPAVADSLTGDWEIWLKDGQRTHEKECVDRWSMRYPLTGNLSRVDRRGVWMLGPGQPSPRLAPAISGVHLPRVSCLMPTFDRRPFVRRAVEYFLRQDYPNLELIVVDDGVEPVNDLLVSCSDIRYERLDTWASIGEKRNIAADLARGDILICWDDDDWYGNRRVSYQVGPMIRDEADASALGRSLLYSIPTARFWQATPAVHARMFYQQVVGGTLAFRKSLWADGIRFPNASLAEDAAVIRSLIARGFRLCKLKCDDQFVYIRHDANSWRFQAGRYIDRHGWKAMAQPAFISADDLTFYHNLRAPT